MKITDELDGQLVLKRKNVVLDTNEDTNMSACTDGITNKRIKQIEACIQ